jgi:hypothetical protein
MLFYIVFHIPKNLEDEYAELKCDWKFQNASAF